MSWLFSQALVAEYSAGCSSDGEQFAPSNTTSTPAMFLSHGKMTDALNLSRFGMTCEPLTENLGAALLMSFQAASHAKTFQTLESGQESTENEADCGEKCLESFAKYDPDSYSWKTVQLFLFGGLSEFSGTWPQSGTIRNMKSFQRVPLVRHIHGNECGLFPTPTKSFSEGNGKINNGNHDTVRGFREKIPNSFGRTMNADWIEWLMGWPVRWSALNESAMDKFQQWQQRHGTSCAKEPPPGH